MMRSKRLKINKQQPSKLLRKPKRQDNRPTKTDKTSRTKSKDRKPLPAMLKSQPKRQGMLLVKPRKMPLIGKRLLRLPNLRLHRTWLLPKNKKRNKKQHSLKSKKKIRKSMTKLWQHKPQHLRPLKNRLKQLN